MVQGQQITTEKFSEETIIARELSVQFSGNLDVKASGVGEILSADEFYDFDAKYYNSESKTLVDPPMPENMREQIREDAVKNLCQRPMEETTKS